MSKAIITVVGKETQWNYRKRYVLIWQRTM